MSHVRRKTPRNPTRVAKRRNKDRKRQFIGILILLCLFMGSFITAIFVLLAGA